MGGRVAQRKYSRSSGSCDWGRQNGGGRMLGPERGDVISVAFLTACLPAWCLAQYLVAGTGKRNG